MHKVDTVLSRLAKNSIFGLIRYIITVPILFLAVPYILRSLGNELFGVWSLFGVVTTYAGLGDLGIGSGLTRFIAQHWAANDEQAINRAVSTVFTIYFLVGGVTSGGIFLGRRFISMMVFDVPAPFAEEAVSVVMGSAVAFFILLLSGVFNALIQGFQRMDLLSVSSIIYVVLDAGGSVILLCLGYGLRALVVNRILSCLVIALISLYMTVKLMPGFTIRVSYFDLRVGREIVRYSLNILVSKISAVAMEPLNKTILVRVASLEGLTFFDLGARLANKARGVFSAMLLAPLLPASSGIHTTGGIRATQQLYYRMTRYVVLLAFPVFGGLFVLADPIINLWIGPGYELVVLTLQLLLVAFFFALLASPAYIIMEGVGLAKVSALTSIISALLNVALSIGLGLWQGYLGVLAGYCLALIITSLVTLILFYHRLAVSFGGFLRAIPFKAMLFEIFIMILVGVFVSQADIQSIFYLAVTGLIYFVLCAFGILISGSVRESEITTVWHLLTSAR